MKTRLEIQNLKCGGCANTITKRLSALEHIEDVTVDNASHSVAFSYATEDALKTAEELLSKLGYPTVEASNSLGKKAKSFVSCAIGRMDA